MFFRNYFKLRNIVFVDIFEFFQLTVRLKVLNKNKYVLTLSFRSKTHHHCNNYNTSVVFQTHKPVNKSTCRKE